MDDIVRNAAYGHAALGISLLLAQAMRAAGIIDGAGIKHLCSLLLVAQAQLLPTDESGRAHLDGLLAALAE